jgi:hypothetical protein
MPEYTSRVMKPDGTPYKITGPDGATPEQVDQMVSRQVPNAPAPSRSLYRRVIDPQTFGEHVASFAIDAPLIAAGGLLGGPPGAIGTAAALTGGRSALRGDTMKDVALQTGLGAAAGALPEVGSAVVRGLPKVGPVKLGLKELGTAAREFTKAKSELVPAAEAIKDTLANTVNRQGFSYLHPLAKDVVLTVPSMSPKPIMLKDAAKALEGMRGRQYQSALADVAEALEKVKPGIGESFLRHVSPALFDPPKGSALAEAANRLLKSPLLKAPAEALAIEGVRDPSTDKSVPLGTLAEGALVGMIPGMGTTRPRIGVGGY